MFSKYLPFDLDFKVRKMINADFPDTIHGVHSLFVFVFAATGTSSLTFSKESEAFGLKVCNVINISVWKLI
jgi:hypothetical protein